MIMTADDKASSERPHTAIFAINLVTAKRSVNMITCEITVASLESTEEQLETSVISSCVSEMST